GLRKGMAERQRTAISSTIAIGAASLWGVEPSVLRLGLVVADDDHLAALALALALALGLNLHLPIPAARALASDLPANLRRPIAQRDRHRDAPGLALGQQPRERLGPQTILDGVVGLAPGVDLDVIDPPMRRHAQA